MLMFNLELPMASAEAKGLAKKIREYNKTASQWLADWNRVTESLHRCHKEGVEGVRMPSEILAEFYTAKEKLFDLFAIRVRLLDDREALLSQLLSDLGGQIDKQVQICQEAIDAAKTRMEEAGCGLESIMSAANLNRGSAEIQFEHRARQNMVVKPLLHELDCLKGQRNQFQTMEASTKAESEKVLKTFLDLWALATSGPRILSFIQ